MTNRLLTIPDVALRLRRSPKSLEHLRYQGTGPRFAKIAGRIYYRESDVESWLEEAFDDQHAIAG